MINHFWDLFVVFVYMAIVIIIAFYQGKSKRENQDDAKEQYLAGKSLSFWESICSIIATETSALTFLGIPAIAYKGNFSFLQIYMGAIFGRFFIAKFLLPRLYNKELTAYSSLTKGNGRKTMASVFIMSKVLSVGVRLYSGSILIALFFGLSPYVAVVITLALTFFYTLVGGLKAVVKTDMMQLALFVFGGLIAHYMIPQTAGLTWFDMMKEAFISGKFSLSMNHSYHGYFIGIIAGFLFDIATHGTDQDFMQRLLASKSLKSAQRAIFFSSFASIGVALIFLGVGALLWSYSEFVQFPTHLEADKTFAYFITHFFPTGVKGLMLAGILAATMSTVDSTINAICACLHSDIFPRRKKKLRFYLKRDTIITSLLLLVVAIVASHSTGILKLGLTVQSWTAGPMLAFFTSFLWFKKDSSHLNINVKLFIIFIGAILGVGFNTFILKQTWHWNTYWGFTMGMMMNFLLIRFFRRRE